MARPSEYTPELAAEICQRIAEGASLVTICKDDAMPGRSTVHQWLAATPEFADRYARAREDQADTMADDIVEIADTEADPQRARVRIDARKWVASKLKPKKYGEKFTGELTGDLTVTVMRFTDAEK